MPKRAPKPSPEVETLTERSNREIGAAEAPGSGGLRMALPPSFDVDRELGDLFELLKHIEGAPRAALPGLVADAQKRITAVRSALSR